MKQQNEATREKIFSEVIMLISITIVTFCMVACYYKLYLCTAWIAKSICTAISTIVGGSAMICLSWYTNTNEGFSKMTDTEQSKRFNTISNGFLLAYLASILLGSYIAGILFGVNDWTTYVALISFFEPFGFFVIGWEE